MPITKNLQQALFTTIVGPILRNPGVCKEFVSRKMRSTAGLIWCDSPKECHTNAVFSEDQPLFGIPYM